MSKGPQANTREMIFGCKGAFRNLEWGVIVCAIAEAGI